MNRFGKYTIVLFALCACIIVTGCTSKQSSNQYAQVKKWSFKKGFDRTFTKGMVSTQDNSLIESFAKLYQLNSYEAEFVTLVFYKVMLDDKRQFRFYLFDIKYTRHDIVVFKVNEDNQLIDNYLIATGFH
ncbi:MAG: hypothetical protein HRT35_16300 [Algicola sp.]|nr:hypothetical protein [Algicola sp.]